MKSAAKIVAWPCSAKATPPPAFPTKPSWSKPAAPASAPLAEDVVECRFSALLPLLEKDSMTDQEIDDALLASRVDPKAKKPSVEAVFHAYFLSLPGIKFVGHSHATAVNQILCSPRARDFADKPHVPG